MNGIAGASIEGAVLNVNLAIADQFAAGADTSTVDPISRFVGDHLQRHLRTIQNLAPRETT